MIAEAHEIREKQSVHRAHVINNVAIKNQNQTEDSVFILIFIYGIYYMCVCTCAHIHSKYLVLVIRTKKIVVEQ